jgi:hypothetical protein
MSGRRTDGEVNRNLFLTDALDGGEESEMANRAAHGKFNINVAGTQTGLQNRLSTSLVQTAGTPNTYWMLFLQFSLV